MRKGFGWLGGLFGGKAAPMVRASEAVYRGLKSAKWMGRSAKNYAIEGYSQNVIVFRCVQIIAESLASIPLQVQDRNGDRHDEHPALGVLRSPNPLQSQSQLLEAMTAHRLISGKAFLEKITVNGAAKELWPWPCYSMRVVTRDNQFLPVAYKYENGSQRRQWEVDPITGKSDILNWHSFHPFDLNDGLSPIGAAAHSVDQHNEAGKWNMRMLQNSAEPSGAMFHEKWLTPEQVEQLQGQLKNSYSGADNARKSMILHGGLDWRQISLSPKDMDWLQGKNASAQDIAAAFGVPLQVIPLPGSQTFANYEEARLALWEDTVLPLGQGLLEELTRFVMPGIDDSARFVFDINEIPALSSRRREKWEAVNTAKDRLTINEYREALGYEPYDNSGEKSPADQIWIPSGVLPLDFGSTSGEENQEENDNNLNDDDLEDNDGDD